MSRSASEDAARAGITRALIASNTAETQAALRAVGAAERDPVLRWSVIGLFWLLFMVRAFGRTTGHHRGPFNWYDWLVIVVGTADESQVRLTAERLAAAVQDDGDRGQGEDVVDHRGPAEESSFHRVRRPHRQHR